MLLNEQIIIRVAPDGRRYIWWTAKVGVDIDNNGIPDQGVTGGATPTTYTSAATMCTAIQAALPTLAS